MKREELKAYRPYANRDGFYHKSEADKVMDEYEQRIKHLEEILDSDPRTNLRIDEENSMLLKRIKELETQLENVQSSMYAENVDANMALVKANERIKELECDKAYLENDKQVCAECLRLKELEAENERLKAENESLKIIDENLREVQENFEKSFIKKMEENQQLKAENARLKKQVPVWHNLYKPLYVDENGNDVWDLPNEDEADANGDVYTIHKCGACGTEQWDEIDPEVIAMWCELPTAPTTTDESSAAEKEVK